MTAIHAPDMPEEAACKGKGLDRNILKVEESATEPWSLHTQSIQGRSACPIISGSSVHPENEDNDITASGA